MVTMQVLWKAQKGNRPFSIVLHYRQHTEIMQGALTKCTLLHACKRLVKITRLLQTDAARPWR